MQRVGETLLAQTFFILWKLLSFDCIGCTYCQVNHTILLDEKSRDICEKRRESAARSNTMNMKYKMVTTVVIFAGLRIALLDLGLWVWQQWNAPPVACRCVVFPNDSFQSVQIQGFSPQVGHISGYFARNAVSRSIS